MNTRLLMGASATYMALLGTGAMFFPREILVYFGGRPDGIDVVFVGLVGALYLGFTALNWMARGNLIGGIYSRPVAMGNFVHFFIVALSLLPQLFALSHPIVIAGGVAINATFATAFGYVLFVQRQDRGTSSTGMFTSN